MKTSEKSRRASHYNAKIGVEHWQEESHDKRVKARKEGILEWEFSGKSPNTVNSKNLKKRKKVVKKKRVLKKKRKLIHKKKVLRKKLIKHRKKVVHRKNKIIKIFKKKLKLK